MDTVCLLNAAADGDRESYGLIYDEFASSLYGEACDVLGPTPEAEDVVNGVFLCLFKNAWRFKGNPMVALRWARWLARTKCMALKTLQGETAGRVGFFD